MGLMIKCLCAILVIGLAGMFVLKTPDGKPWLSIDDFMPDTSVINELAKNASSLLEKNNTSENNSSQYAETATKNSLGIYRWKDAKGQWQFSDTPPTNQQAEIVNVNGHLNSDLGGEFTPAEQKQTTSSVIGDTSSNSILPATLSPEKVSKLIEDAKNVQQLMDDRQSQLDSKIH